MNPLVSCIMPTYNRPAFVPRAVEYFLRQDYPDRELIVVDSGGDRLADRTLRDARIRYVRPAGKPTVGAARNLGCELARGELIAHWDDDDWHAPHRIRYQVEALLQSGAELCGLDRVLYFDCRDRSAWLYAYPPGGSPWIHGNSLCYRRAFWNRVRFADIDIGEDTRFVANARRADVLALPDSTFHISIMHGGNVSAHRPCGPYWTPHDVSQVRAILGADWEVYGELARRG